MSIDTDKLTQIIEQGDTDALIQYAETVGNRAGKADLGTTQIRNIYGMVKQLQAQAEPDYNQLKLLVPKLKYAAAKQSALKELTQVLSVAISMIGDDSQKFKRFCDFFEAVVAYHYSYTKGGS